MEVIRVPSSITIDKRIIKKKYSWKSRNKKTIYLTKSRKAVLRITSKKFAEELSKKNKKHRQVKIEFKREERMDNKSKENKEKWKNIASLCWKAPIFRAYFKQPTSNATLV